MKKGKKDLFIIFGATSGIGKALYVYASRFPENEFILANRKSAKMTNRNVYRRLTLDLSRSFTRDQLAKLRQIFSQLEGYRSVCLVLNASVIRPIRRIGTAGDELLVEACHVNFLNYERIINSFIAATRHLRARKKILAISSGAAETPQIGLSSYCSTKAALEMFVKCFFLEQQRKSEYSILAVRPGVVDTKMQKKIRSSNKENFPKVDLYRKAFKQKKLLKPEWVAHKIYSLLKPDLHWTRPVIDISEIA